jgi:hypothetical protein
MAWLRRGGAPELDLIPSSHARGDLGGQEERGPADFTHVPGGIVKHCLGEPLAKSATGRDHALFAEEPPRLDGDMERGVEQHE